MAESASALRSSGFRHCRIGSASTENDPCPIHSVFFCGFGIPNDRSSSLGWSSGSPTTGLRRWGDYRGPPQQVFVLGGTSGSPTTALRRWGDHRGPQRQVFVVGVTSGSPTTGLRRWGDHRGPQRQVFVVGVIIGVPNDR